MKQLFCCATFISAVRWVGIARKVWVMFIYIRIIDGGGVHSLVVDQQHFIYFYLQYIISTTSLALRVWHRVSSTLATPS